MLSNTANLQLTRMMKYNKKNMLNAKSNLWMKVVMKSEQISIFIPYD